MSFRLYVCVPISLLEARTGEQILGQSRRLFPEFLVGTRFRNATTVEAGRHEGTGLLGGILRLVLLQPLQKELARRIGDHGVSPDRQTNKQATNSWEDGFLASECGLFGLFLFPSSCALPRENVRFLCHLRKQVQDRLSPTPLYF